MKTITNALAVSAVAAGVLGTVAPGASAFYAVSPSSTPFTGTGLTNQTFKIGLTGPTITCTTSTFPGMTSSLGWSFSFVPSFSGTGSGGSCPGGVLGNVKITGAAPGGWNVALTGGGPSPGPYTGSTSMFDTLTFTPLTVPSCTITIIPDPANQSLPGLYGVNIASPLGVRVYGFLPGIKYTASSGCPGVPSGTRADAIYNTGGTSASGGISFPGISFSGP